MKLALLLGPALWILVGVCFADPPLADRQKKIRKRIATTRRYISTLQTRLVEAHSADFSLLYDMHVRPSADTKKPHNTISVSALTRTTSREVWTNLVRRAVSDALCESQMRYREAINEMVEQRQSAKSDFPLMRSRSFIKRQLRSCDLEEKRFSDHLLQVAKSTGDYASSADRPRTDYKSGDALRWFPRKPPCSCVIL